MFLTSRIFKISPRSLDDRFLEADEKKLYKSEWSIIINTKTCPINCSATLGGRLHRDRLRIGTNDIIHRKSRNIPSLDFIIINLSMSQLVDSYFTRLTRETPRE